jgi:DNA-binding Lrp family transcriptional regulator
MSDEPVLDALDLALLTTLRQSPRAGILDLSRTVKVARATVQSRLDRMERAGVITGYGPDIDIVVAGYPVQAFVTLEIAQGSLDKLHRDLSSIPGVLEAYATTGTGDVLCRVAAASNAELQQTLLQLNGSPWVTRSTSAVLLSTVVAPRAMPLLESRPRPSASRAPAFRDPGRKSARREVGALAPPAPRYRAVKSAGPPRRAESKSPVPSTERNPPLSG